MNTKTFYKDIEFDLNVEQHIRASVLAINFYHKKTEKERVKISGETLEQAKDKFSYAVGYDLTMEQMLQVAFTDTDVIYDLSSGCTDTPAIDNFSNAFAKLILNDGRTWPVGGDTREYKTQFFSDLNEAAEKLGYVKNL